jgi:hypothetical protein
MHVRWQEETLASIYVPRIRHKVALRESISAQEMLRLVRATQGRREDDQQQSK